MERSSRQRKKLSPREAAVSVVRDLREAGYVAYLAGGCVRDDLLGLVPMDYDVATDALPEQVRKILPRSRYVGEHFGVVLAYRGRQAVEVATFRTEWGYSDKRRPDHVEFTDAEHDARRRDFTINGLFADPLEIDAETGTDRIIDYVGGRADLEHRLVRAIGDPSERFGEDYLRMLRAVRFAARLGFAIEKRTAAAIRPLAPRLGEISRERIGQEVQAMLEGPRPAEAARLMQALHLDGPALSEDHQEAFPAMLEAVEPEAPYPVKLAAWMFDRYRPDQPVEPLAHFAQAEAGRVVKRWRRALTLSNQQRDDLAGVLALLSELVRWDELGVAKRKRLLAGRLWEAGMQLLRALPTDGLRERIEHDAMELLAEGVAPEPLITGDDLIHMGLEPGPQFGRLLEAVYDAQLEGRVTTPGEAAAWIHERLEA
ncbi:MAG: CCA tRNA nucleotidyltransferase [Phycisphaeraceae bacterium]